MTTPAPHASSVSPAGVRLDVDGQVATVTLCRPEVLNAQTPALWAALRDFGRELSGDIRVVVVRGEGRSFSAGLDAAAMAGGELAGGLSLTEMAKLSEDECAALIAGYQEAFSWLRRPDLVTVAAVQGHAIGAGFQLALACDLRVLADDAKFTMAEPTLGLVPDLGGTQPLVQLVGYSRALEICATGRRVGALEAERIGLATLVVPGEELTEAVADLVAALLGPNRDAVVETKALLLGATDRSYADQLAAERSAQVRRLRDLVGLGE
ncbi:enoyl-CoA hydratase/isomerase family protein [Longispora sp. NPDC051575]|uniref:enoyl-CoA hydratase/isomerase family protein n=1 Tax=Longispora sp. NPDC051575 TaxID=3154943 RepID=UPI0034390CE6